MVCTPDFALEIGAGLKPALRSKKRSHLSPNWVEISSTLLIQAKVCHSTRILLYTPSLQRGQDRRPALLSILRSMLVTYSTLTTSLLAPPPTISSNVTPDWQRHVQWITDLAQNIMAAANDLRPVQVCWYRLTCAPI